MIEIKVVIKKSDNGTHIYMDNSSEDVQHCEDIVGREIFSSIKVMIKEIAGKSGSAYIAEGENAETLKKLFSDKKDKQ